MLLEILFAVTKAVHLDVIVINDLFKHAPNTVGFVLSTHSYDEIIKFLSKLLSQLKSVLLLLIFLIRSGSHTQHHWPLSTLWVCFLISFSSLILPPMKERELLSAKVVFILICPKNIFTLFYNFSASFLYNMPDSKLFYFRNVDVSSSDFYNLF